VKLETAGTSLNSGTGYALGGFVWSIEANGSSSEIRRDNVSVASGNAGTGGTTTGFRIGAERNLNSGFWSGMAYGEILVYDRILNSTERGLIQSYLSAKWT
jgi:hypothetical protein